MGGERLCKPCAVGTSRVGTELACVACARGQANAVLGSARCSDCPAGMFAADVGTTYCKKCARGTFAASSGAAVCVRAVQPGATGVTAAEMVAVTTSMLLSGFSVHGFESARTPFRRAVTQLVGEPATLASVVIVDVQQGAHALDGAGDLSPPSSRRLAAAADAAFDRSRGVQVQLEVQGNTTAWAGRVQGQLRQLQSNATVTSLLVTSLEQHMQTDGIAPPAGLNMLVVEPVRVGPAMCSAGYFFVWQGAVTPSICVACPAGKHKVSAGSADARCNSCTVGRFNPMNASSVACHACQPGKSNPLLGAVAASSCEMCAAGAMAPNAGTARCSLCAPGRSQGERAQTSCSRCGPGRFASNVGSVACLKCGMFGAAIAGSDAIGAGTLNDQRTSCTPDVAATTGLTFCFIAVGILLLFYSFHGPKDCGGMSWSKRRMILGASGDFITDAFYIATAVYDSADLKKVAIAQFVLPTAAFMVFRHKLVWQHLGNLREKYEAETGEPWKPKLSHFLRKIFKMGFWLVALGVWYPCAMVLAINCKLFAFKSFTDNQFELSFKAGKAGKKQNSGGIIQGSTKASRRISEQGSRRLRRGTNGEEDTVRERAGSSLDNYLTSDLFHHREKRRLNKSFNLTLVFELFLATLPSVCITFYNWYLTGASWDDKLFLVSMGFSFWAMAEGAFPLAFWVNKLSWEFGSTVELFDDWTCPVCSMENSADAIACGGPSDGKGKWWLPWSGGGEGTCGEKHPELQQQAARRAAREVVSSALHNNPTATTLRANASDLATIPQHQTI